MYAILFGLGIFLAFTSIIGFSLSLGLSLIFILSFCFFVILLLLFGVVFFFLVRGGDIPISRLVRTCRPGSSVSSRCAEQNAPECYCLVRDRKRLRMPWFITIDFSIEPEILSQGGFD